MSNLSDLSNLSNLSNLRAQYESILGAIRSNRMLVFPPPVADPDLLVERLNLRNILKRRKVTGRVTGRKLLRYFVSKQNSYVSAIIINHATSYLWSNATEQEKETYNLLASQVNIKARTHSFTRQTTTVDLVNPMITTTVIANSPVQKFTDIGYSDLHDVISWWEDEKDLYEEDSEEDIMISFFNEKFGETSDFMDIVNHFSQQTKTELLYIYNIFLAIFDEYTPWEWFSWYIHMSYTFTRTPAPCPFHSGDVNLPENILSYHYHYTGTVSKSVKDEQVEQFGEFINVILKNKYQGDSRLKVWYHGTNSVHAASIAHGIDLTVCHHFGHAFGFHRSFYIGENLKYCLIRALKAAGSLSVNCALIIFCINEENLYQLQDYLILTCKEEPQEDLRDDVPFGIIWENVVPISRNSNSTHNNLNDDPIQPNVQWVEGANLKRSQDHSWTPKRDNIIRSFRTERSAQFLHSQLAFIITFKNPRVD